MIPRYGSASHATGESGDPVIPAAEIRTLHSALHHAIQAAQAPVPPGAEREGAIFEARSDDADAQAALLQGWNQDYAQISAGKFSGTIREARISDVSLFIESTSQALLQSGALAKDVVAIGVPLELPEAAVFCGTPTRERAVHVFSGKGGFEFFSPAGLVMSGIAVPRQALEEHLTTEERSRIAPKLGGAHLASGDPRGLEAMRNFVQGVLEVAGSSPALLCNIPLRKALRDSVLDNLAQLLVGCFPSPAPTARIGRAWKVVSEARDFILSRPESPTNIAEICDAVGVSRRTLQYCFQDVLGVSPMEFLRAIRLGGARRLLRTAPSVTDAAAHWGFWHFGYFSQDYRHMFGELPSQTHRRFHSGGAPQR
jgi:AraC family ethanolamine operon transcriptional activator